MTTMTELVETIAESLQDVEIAATEADRLALVVARHNATMLKLAERVEFEDEPIRYAGVMERMKG